MTRTYLVHHISLIIIAAAFVVGLPGGESICQAQAPASAPSVASCAFTIDAAGQIDGRRTARLVNNTWAVSALLDNPELPDAWIQKRFEGTIRFVADWFLLNIGTPGSAAETCYVEDRPGHFVFVPRRGIEHRFDQWVLRAGVKPLLVVGTANIPDQLIEGGPKYGQYGYQIHHPNDYAKWKVYIESMLDWLVGRYGREEVRTWGFCLGIESDWQAEAVYPGTRLKMSERENRREFARLVDVFHAACVKKLGPGAYVGCYFAFVEQADDFARHWADETNDATGRRGTRIAWCGFSDWCLLNKHPRNPFAPRPAEHTAMQANTWGSGYQWKYDVMAGVLDAYPALRGMELALPEMGYFDEQGALKNSAEVPGDFSPADHRGAALYAMRAIATAQSPLLTWAINRYALGAGDMGCWWDDDIKAAIFHVQRIQHRMEGERLLPVAKSGTPTQPGNDVRLMATAADTTSPVLRVMAVNFNEDFAADRPETVTLRVENLPAEARRITVREFRIDAAHNNWWADWKAWREANGLPYVAGPNHSALGSNLDLKAKYVPWHNNVEGYLRPEDRPKWLERMREYKAREALSPTADPVAQDVVNGIAQWKTTLPCGVIYYEITWEDRQEKLGRNLDFAEGKLEGWTVSGRRAEVARPVPDAVRAEIVKPRKGRRDGAGVALLATEARGTSLTQTVSGLLPGASYTFTAETRATARVFDYGISLAHPDGAVRVEAAGDWSALWNRLVVTARADAQGRLVLGLRVGAQPCDADDVAWFTNLQLRRN